MRAGIVSDELDAESRLQANVVTSITLRELLEKTGVERVDFLKVDIEGAEVQVFRSLAKDKETFDRIQRVTVEWHGRDRQRFAQEILENAGFKVEDDHPFEDPAFGHVGYLYGVRE